MTGRYSASTGDPGVFTPEEVAALGASLDGAWDGLPSERRTPGTRKALAYAIMDLATHGERDPARLIKLALEEITPEAPHGAI